MTADSTVAIKGDMIRLGQFLKVADAVDQGSDVKALLATEAVTVNGEVEVRRGRQLHLGDVVAVGPTTYLLTRRPGATPADTAATSRADDTAATSRADDDGAETGDADDGSAATGQASGPPSHPASGRYSSGS